MNISTKTWVIIEAVVITAAAIFGLAYNKNTYNKYEAEQDAIDQAQLLAQDKAELKSIKVLQAAKAKAKQSADFALIEAGSKEYSGNRFMYNPDNKNSK